VTDTIPLTVLRSASSCLHAISMVGRPLGTINLAWFAQLDPESKHSSQPSKPFFRIGVPQWRQ